MTESAADTSSDLVAIVGFACRYPGVENVDEFWRMVRDGTESLTRFSDEEIKASGVPESLLSNPYYVKVGSVLSDIEMFDHAFFGYSPNEARIIDPQQRIFLETAWEALEHAGCDPNRCDGRIAVFAGTGMSEYLIANLLPRWWELEGMMDKQTVISGNSKDALSTRVAYKLDLRGPAVTVGTECSTSLVATCLGWQSLVDYQSDISLVGGAYLPGSAKGYLWVPGSYSSADGSSRPFDAQAKGFRPGAGVGVAVLKRLDDALADGDQVYAVIRGAALNNDGGRRAGYTAPSVTGQAEVIAEALAIADVGADTIGYVETHGTATPLGDPIEFAGLCQAFGITEGNGAHCALGSLKANIGHSIYAAGVGSLIKAALVLYHRELPPLANFSTPNPEINFAKSPFYVPKTRQQWENSGAPRRAGVSSFGMGGTNAHVVLEEAPSLGESGKTKRCQRIIALSAKTDQALGRMSANLVSFLEQRPDISLPDVSYTLLTGRSEFEHRRCEVVETTQELFQRLSEGDAASSRAGSDVVVGLVLPDADHWSPKMTHGLYEIETVFRDHVDECAAWVSKDWKLDFHEVLYPKQKSDKSDELAPLACFVVEYALCRTLMNWGVKPTGFFGVGVGELAAAALADVLSPKDALAALSWSVHRRAGGKRRKRPLLAAKLEAPHTQLFNGATADWVTAEQATDPVFWEQRIVEPVGASDFTNLLAGRRWVLLNTSGNQWPADALPLVAESEKKADDERVLSTTLAQLWCAGGSVDWKCFFAAEQRRHIALPTYPFARVRCWVDAPSVDQTAGVRSSAQMEPLKPQSVQTERSTPYVAPTNELEREIAEVWEEILGVEQVGIHDNFMELGGDSLLATRIVTRINEAYQIEITIRVLMEVATVQEMATVVGRELVDGADEEELATLLAEVDDDESTD